MYVRRRIRTGPSSGPEARPEPADRPEPARSRHLSGEAWSRRGDHLVHFDGSSSPGSPRPMMDFRHDLGVHGRGIPSASSLDGAIVSRGPGPPHTSRASRVDRTSGLSWTPGFAARASAAARERVDGLGVGPCRGAWELSGRSSGRPRMPVNRRLRVAPSFRLFALARGVRTRRGSGRP